MSPLSKAIRAFHHMSDEERLLWILGVSAVLSALHLQEMVEALAKPSRSQEI
jgi:hypothetical protein